MQFAVINKRIGYKQKFMTAFASSVKLSSSKTYKTL